MAAWASRFLDAGLEGEPREARLREIHQQVLTNMLRFAARLTQDAKPPGDPIVAVHVPDTAGDPDGPALGSGVATL